MEFKNCATHKLFGVLLLMCISRVCHGQLMCYVCDDCAHITDKTPQFECNEKFFNTGGATETSMQTTTQPSKTTAGVTEDNDTTTTEETTHISASNSTEGEAMTTTTTTTTTTTKTTTESKTPEATTKVTTTNATETSTETTTEPTAEITTTQETVTTHGKPNSTENPNFSSTAADIAKPTTPMQPISSNPVILKPVDDVETLNNKTMAHSQHVNKDEVENVEIEEGTTKAYKPSGEFRIRQLRSISDVTYHCFKIHATNVNGTMVVNRGCSRIQANESVCDQWKSQHSNEKMNKCIPCSNTKCNGSSALNVSITAFILVVVAVFMQGK